MTSGIYGLRLLRDPGFRRVLLIVLAIVVATLRLIEIVQYSSRIQWGYDFSFYWRVATALLHGAPIYSADQLTGPYAPQGQGGFLYPPPFAAAMTPFAMLFPSDYRLAAWAWAAIGVAILATGVLALVRSEGLTDRVRASTGLGAWIVAVAALTFPPVVGELVLGNVHLLIFGLLTVAWLGIRRAGPSGERQAGIAVGLAALIKVFPGLIVLWFLLTGRRRAAGWAVAAALVAGLVALPITGTASWVDFPRALLNLSAPADTTDTLAPTVWLASAVGFTTARVLVTGTALLVLALAARRLDARRSYATAMLLSLLIAPALYHHYLAIAVLPMLLLSAETGTAGWIALAYLLMSGGTQVGLGDFAWLVNRAMPTAGSLLLLVVALRRAEPRSARSAVPSG